MHQELTGPQGGFSANVRTGQAPQRGWMVSQAGTEERRPMSQTSPADIQSYAVRHKSVLRKAGYAGGWAGPKNEAYLDASRRYPGTTEGFLRAGRAMERHQQKGIYNVGTQQTYTSQKRSGKSYPEFLDSPEDLENRQIHQAWATSRLRERGIALPE
jgi:hypothetical protein